MLGRAPYICDPSGVVSATTKTRRQLDDRRDRALVGVLSPSGTTHTCPSCSRGTPSRHPGCAFNPLRPDELWEELARLTGWNGPPESRPRYWAGLVIELIYDTLDPEAAGYLREHRPRDVHPHRNAAGDHGPEQLLSRCYEIVGLSRSCDSIGELRRKVAQHYARQPMLFSIFEIPASPDD